MTGALIRRFALLVPQASRPRWREEWRAELACVERHHGVRGAIRVAFGALPDANARCARKMHPEGLYAGERSPIVTGARLTEAPA